MDWIFSVGNVISEEFEKIQGIELMRCEAVALGDDYSDRRMLLRVGDDFLDRR